MPKNAVYVSMKIEYWKKKKKKYDDEWVDLGHESETL